MTNNVVNATHATIGLMTEVSSMDDGTELVSKTWEEYSFRCLDMMLADTA